MLSLIKSKRSQEEYKDFQTKISKVENETLKKELTNLLGRLVNEVRALDSLHSDLTLRNQLPSGSVDSKSQISDIRKQIQKRLTDYANSQTL